MINGKEAAAIGLVNDSVDSDANGEPAYARALEIAREILRNVRVVSLQLRSLYNTSHSLLGPNRCDDGEACDRCGRAMRPQHSATH